MKTTFVQICAAAALLAPLTAQAGGGGSADLSVSISAPSGVHVYEAARYTVQVKNIGKKSSAGGTLTIPLPQTGTSPTTHVLGTLGARSNGCSLSGTNLTCSVPSTGKGVTRSFFFDLAAPQSAAPMQLGASVAPAGADASSANNAATRTLSLLHYDEPIAAPVDTVNSHCTGVGLTSFFECELYPSSISFHEITLNPNGSISFDPQWGGVYTGAWTQPTAQELTLSYLEYGSPAASFNGYATGDGCFEGLTTFPNSQYVSPYQVCLQ